MSRPRRNPASPAKRVTVFLDPDTVDTLQRTSTKAGASIGVLIDQLVADHRVAVADPVSGRRPESPAIRAKEISPDIPGVTKGMPAPSRGSAHPGWRADATGANVCTACGGRKTAVNGKPCPGGAT